MIITFQKETCFVLQKKDLSIITDPFDKDSNLISRAKTNIAVISSNEKNNLSKIQTDYIIQNPGEYEISKVIINGLGCLNDSEKPLTIYNIKMDDINVGYLGRLNKPLTESQIESLGDVNLLIIPFWEEMDMKASLKMINQIEPQIVIPSLYNEEILESLKKEFGGKYSEENKFNLNKKDFPVEGPQLFILK